MIKLATDQKFELIALAHLKILFSEIIQIIPIGKKMPVLF